MRPSTWLGITAASALLATLIGCGGAGSDGATGTPPPDETVNTKEQATARLDVDLTTGAVKVTPMNPGQNQTRSIFTGSAVSITSTPVSSDPGEITIRRLKLSIKNNTPESIGGTPGAMLVVDRVATDDLGAVNLREFSNVSTIIGPGTSANDGPGPSVTISQPTGLDIDADGAIFIVGQGDGTLRRHNENFVNRLATGIATPGGVAVLPGSDFVFMTEQTTHNIVRVPKSGGTKFVIAGGGVTGLTDGSGTTARFNLPRDIAIFGSSAFVADYNNDRIRKITNLTGSAGTVSTLNVFPLITRPSGLAMMPLGGTDWLVVSSTQTHKIHLVNSVNGQSFQIAGTGTSGSADGFGNVATFDQPSDVAVIGSSIFVAEIGNRVIRQISLKPGAEPTFASSWAVKTLAGSGTSGAIDGQGTVAQFASPRYLAADKSGSLYASDLSNNRIRKVIGVSSALPITGTGGSGGTVQIANPDRFIPSPGEDIDRKAVFDIADIDPAGESGDKVEKNLEFTVAGSVTSFYFFVSIIGESDSIGVLDAVANSTINLKGSINVNVRTLAGSQLAGGHDGDANSATFAYPRITRAGAGIYICNFSTNSIRRYDMATGVTRTIAGVAFGSVTAGGTGTTSSIPSPIDIWMNENETEGYVVTMKHVVLRLSRTSGNAGSSDNWTVAIIAGSDSVSGNVTGTGNTARFSAPTGIVADSSGANLYICDSNNNNIKRMIVVGNEDRNTPGNWSVGHYAGSTSAAAGDTDGVGGAARFRVPFEIARSRNGSLYIVESSGHRVRRINSSLNVSLVAGSPTAGAGASDGIGGLLFNPNDIALDESGFAYVADEGNDVIRRINLATSEIRTVAGQRNTALFMDGSGATCGLDNPVSTCFVPGEGLYVSDNLTLRLIERVVRTGQP